MLMDKAQLPHNNHVNSPKRESCIDTLRAFGLILLMLAHVHPNIIVQQLRCFDVPLMLLISGYVANYNPNEGLFKFYFKRIKRLLIPVYLFLILIFVSWYCASLLHFSKLPDNFNTIIINSFLLLNENSIGFIWIIRVFLFMMIMTPLLHQIKLDSTRCILLTLSCLAILNIVCVSFYNSSNSLSLINFLNKEVFIYSFAYFIVFTAGRCLKVSNFKRFLLLTLFGLTTLSICIIYIHYTGSSFIITDYKYPPRLYFISYGMIISLVLFLLFKKYIPRSINDNKVFKFIGCNTIWIYLWHIPLQEIINTFVLHWFIKWLILVISSCIVFYLQYVLANKFLPQKIKKYFVG